jgi:hypothetical protein
MEESLLSQTNYITEISFQRTYPKQNRNATGIKQCNQRTKYKHVQLKILLVRVRTAKNGQQKQIVLPHQRRRTTIRFTGTNHDSTGWHTRRNH